MLLAISNYPYLCLLTTLTLFACFSCSPFVISTLQYESQKTKEWPRSTTTILVNKWFPEAILAVILPVLFTTHYDLHFHQTAAYFPIY